MALGEIKRQVSVQKSVVGLREIKRDRFQFREAWWG